MSGVRRGIQASVESALWAMANGRCYAPGCPFPVMYEVRPGIHRKNVQIAHIYGVKPSAPRYRRDLPDAERDAFKHLLLLCLPHHADVDDRNTGEETYPPDVLLDWKRQHEGGYNKVLNTIGPVDEDALMEYIGRIFDPPVKRLQTIADQLERTGTLNANSVADLRTIITVLTDNPFGPDARTVRMLTEAVTLLGGSEFPRTVSQLAEAAHLMEGAMRRRGNLM
jgi:hypothetical protein